MLKRIKNYQIILVVGLILIVIFAVFSPCLKNNFVGWDDDQYVTDNIVIQNFSWPGVGEIFRSFFVGNYQPVTILSYFVEYKFFKLDSAGYHLTNLILYLLNCLLVFWLIYLLTRKISISSLTALLFGLHPLHVESVAWVSERKDVLYGLFFLTALVCYCYYLRKPKIRRYYYLTLILFILAILSKAMAITLPLVLFLFDYANNRKADKGMFIEKIPFFILSFIFGVVAVIAQYSIQAVRSENFTSFLPRITIPSYSIIFYLNKIFAPVNLSCLYPYSGIKDISPFLYSLVIFIILLVAVIISAKFTKKIVFGSAFFLIVILPVLQFVPIGGAIVADRYVYIASLGIFYILAEGVFWLFTKKTKHPRLLQCLILAILIAVISVLAALTWKRCHVWNNGISLWNDALSKYPDIITAHNNRGIDYLEQGDVAQAISNFDRIIENQPNFEEAYNNRGIAYKARGNIAQAISDYNKAIELKPSYAEAFDNRADAYLEQGNIAQAMADYSKAIEINPKFIAAYCSRGTVYSQQGNFTQAIADLSRAVDLNPSLAEAYNNRAIAYYLAKEYDLAWIDLHKAEKSGYKVNSDFLNALRKASGRDK
ncbi:MAG: tetratricopeptide repeat protein [Candidatus Omnitrophica bacterium]|nr:tetratricopeptide repeat protein [Candidatus Omnitrophota bacterium]